MRKADVYYKEVLAGQLVELESGSKYQFSYADDYSGPPISLTMPLSVRTFDFKGFPPFFDGLLPEGFQLEALIRRKKIDRNDRFSQLIQVGADTVGAVTIFEHRPPAA